MIERKLVVNQDVVLKQLEINDAQIIFDAIQQNREHLARWLPFVEQTKSIKDTLSFTRSIVEGIERRQEVFTIWYRDRFAGLIGLKDIDYLNYKLEIGYWLVKDMTGKGIITLSVEQLVHYAFNELCMNRIQIKCGVGNLASSAIPKKLGFVMEGVERHGEKHGSRYLDLEVYSILKRDWVD